MEKSTGGTKDNHELEKIDEVNAEAEEEMQRRLSTFENFLKTQKRLAGLPQTDRLSPLHRESAIFDDAYNSMVGKLRLFKMQNMLEKVFGLTQLMADFNQQFDRSKQAMDRINSFL